MTDDYGADDWRERQGKKINHLNNRMHPSLPFMHLPNFTALCGAHHSLLINTTALQFGFHILWLLLARCRAPPKYFSNTIMPRITIIQSSSSSCRLVDFGHRHRHRCAESSLEQQASTPRQVVSCRCVRFGLRPWRALLLGWWQSDSNHRGRVRKTFRIKGWYSANPGTVLTECSQSEEKPIVPLEDYTSTSVVISGLKKVTNQIKMKVFVMLSLVALSAAAPSVMDNQISSADSLFDFTSKMIANCADSNDKVTCLALKGVNAIHRAARAQNLELLPGVNFVR